MSPPPELDQLKGLQLPEPIKDWPIALGWWLLLVITLLSVYSLYQLIRAYYKKNAYRKVALKQLQNIFKDYAANPDTRQMLSAVNSLLKRVAIQQYPQHQCAPLHGDKWQAFLALAVTQYKNIDSDAFGLFAMLYHKQVNIDDQQCAVLYKTSRQWLQKHHRVMANKEQNSV